MADFSSSTVPLSHQAAQLVFPSFQFGKDDPAAAERLADLGVGGFCLYRGKAKEVAALVGRLQERARIPLLFCADYEDGTASHVEGGTPLPSNMAIGAAGREVLAYQKALITAVEARAMGVRWVFAPVLDLSTCPDNPIVNVRAFGDKPVPAAKMGSAYMKGLRSQGVLSCAKHFPGHGETRKDSHLELPTVAVPLRRLLARELRAFAGALGFADSVMLAHLYVPSLGDAPGLPVTLSEKAVGGLLRRRLGYEGLVVTDALNMRAIADRYGDAEASFLALKAGADLLLVPEDPVKLVADLSRRAELDPGLAGSVRAAFARLGRAKDACGLLADRGIVDEADLALVGSDKHRRQALELAAAGLTWVRRAKGSLPDRILYLEPESPDPSAWRGGAFLAELRALGVSAEPYSPGKKGPVLAASFLSPRAYSGRIGLEPKAARSAAAALGKGSPSWLVSFGSPYLFDDVRGYGAGLCAFSGAEPSQKAAARVLRGRAQAGGRMPVPLRCLKARAKR